MKIISKQEQDSQQRATLVGGAKGFLGGAAVALPASYLLHKRWPYYRALPPSLKAFGVILVVVPACVISAEHAGQRFEREQWSRMDKVGIDAARAREAERWKNMTVGEKAQDFIKRRQYSFVLGGWAATMAVTFGIISRNKYQTMPQKVVQARMWAQGLTIGLLLATGALTYADRKKAINESVALHKTTTDHSWRDVIEPEHIPPQVAPQKQRY